MSDSNGRHFSAFDVPSTDPRSAVEPIAAARLAEARDSSRRLADLVRRERDCLADMLLSLAEFDRRGHHRALGFASLFDYLHRSLGLSRGMAHYRQVATRLVHDFPEVVEPVRDGRLCLTTVVELARVMTFENRAEVLPRFFHLSRREAQQVAVGIRPATVVPMRTVVTEVAPVEAGWAGDGPSPGGGRSSTIELAMSHPRVLASDPVMGPEMDRPALSGPEAPSRASQARADVRPLTSTASRLHITVSPDFLALLERARAGQSHVQPGATDEQVLTAALEVLVEKQAKRKASVPATVKREVRERDEGRCTWPTDDGGTCGSTVRTEIDHVVPRGKGGPSTVENCRILCKAHNLEAARRTYGDDLMDHFTQRAPRAGEPAAGYGMPVVEGRMVPRQVEEIRPGHLGQRGMEVPLRLIPRRPRPRNPCRIHGFVIIFRPL
jgi:hypothetical protein